jgi:hypothetical protein
LSATGKGGVGVGVGGARLLQDLAQGGLVSLAQQEAGGSDVLFGMAAPAADGERLCADHPHELR